MMVLVKVALLVNVSLYSNLYISEDLFLKSGGCEQADSAFLDEKEATSSKTRIGSMRQSIRVLGTWN